MADTATVVTCFVPECGEPAVDVAYNPRTRAITFAACEHHRAHHRAPAPEGERSAVYAMLAAGVRAAVDWRAECDGHGAHWTPRQREWIVEDVIEALFGTDAKRRLCVRYVAERETA